MKINRTLSFQICFGFFITNFILLLILGVTFYFSSGDIIVQKDRISITEAIKRRSEYLKGYTDKLRAFSEILAKDDRVYDFLKNKNKSEKPNILKLIENILQVDPYIKTVVILGRDGSVISNEKTLNMNTSKNMMKEEWYLKALKEERAVLNPIRKQKFEQGDMDQWVISISQEIVDESGENLGVLLIDVDYRVLQNYLRIEELDTNQDIVILDDDGNIVYYKDFSMSSEEQLKLNSIKNSDDNYIIQNHKIVTKYKIGNTNWTLIGIASLKELNMLKNNLIKLFFVSGGVSLLIIIVINLLISKKIINPIKKLEKHVNDFSVISLDSELDSGVSEEVLSLTRKFNEMIEKINYLREYEIKALHSQINPHFLYNTLDTIIWMAEFQDTEKVINITKSLANFFRVSLSNGREKITLREEIEHVREYLFIQKQRYEEKLNYSFEIDEDIYEIEVPKIILQPIVENSIYHGIKNLEGAGEIKIYSLTTKDNIQIVIEDNGVGFANTKKKNSLKIGGVGIDNVDKRIKFYYGENYGIVIDHNQKIGAKVIIKLPYIKKYI